MTASPAPAKIAPIAAADPDATEALAVDLFPPNSPANRPPADTDTATSAEPPPTGDSKGSIYTSRAHAHARTEPQPQPDQATTSRPKHGPAGYDWDAIEIDYRAGVKSPRQIAEDHGIRNGDESAVRKHAKRHGWTRDLSRRVRNAARAELLTVATGTAGDGASERRAVESQAQEDAAIKAGASQQVQVVLKHRDYLSRLLVTMDKLLGRLDKIAQRKKMNAELLRQAGQTLDALGRLAARAIPLERRAYNIDDDKGPATEAAAIEHRARRYLAAKVASGGEPEKVKKALAMLGAAEAAQDARKAREAVSVEDRIKAASYPKSA